MIARLAILTAVLAYSLTALAQNRVPTLQWRASGRFFLDVVQDGSPVQFKGDLRDGGKVEVTEGSVTAHLRSYPNFVTVALTEDGVQEGQIFFFEQRNAVFALLNLTPIKVTASGVDDDLDAAIVAAEKGLQLDPAKSESASLAFRQIISYFKVHPDLLLSKYADDVELNRQIAEQGGLPVPKPKTKIPDQNPPDVSVVPNDGGDQTSQDVYPAPQQPRRRRVIQQQPGSDFFNQDDVQPNDGSQYDYQPPPTYQPRRKKRRVYQPLPPSSPYNDPGLW